VQPQVSQMCNQPSTGCHAHRKVGAGAAENKEKTQENPQVQTASDWEEEEEELRGENDRRQNEKRKNKP